MDRRASGGARGALAGTAFLEITAATWASPEGLPRSWEPPRRRMPAGQLEEEDSPARAPPQPREPDTGPDSGPDRVPSQEACPTWHAETGDRDG
ncbi:hypothetical protein NDU88_000552 [Pleurodeles waltl]|uniref:Uncharacterized protein n=1 Tax=Pleurodeles waltl TaxID=8319 RepID=A0AAV7MIX9_PLEWA|nr:hypothetical protein NDU88_000552 [Pleurodeles waltl]